MNIARAIKHIRPTSEWVCGGSYETLIWLDGNTESKPTRQELEFSWSQIQSKIAWETVRAKRDMLLSQSDWTQISDSPCEKTAWAIYRQALRNIPQNFLKPEDVIWPAKPE